MGEGSYKLTGKTSDDGDNVALDISEPSHGLLAELSGLSDLGAVSVAATLVGPRNAEQLGLAMKAGDLTGNGKGTIDIKGQSVDLDLTVAAPAMAPRPDLHWQSANLDLHVHGPFTGPDATGKLAIADLAAGGASIGSIAADLQGNRGKIDLNGVLERVHVPGPQPDLFAAAPIALQAEAILDQPTRPLTFTITHPLIGVTGEAQLGGAMSAIATTSLSNLAPFAALGGAAVEGHGAVVAKIAQQGETMQLSLDGTLDITGGEPMATTLIGENATLAVAGSMTGSDFTVDRAVIDGKGLYVSAHGNSTGGAVDLAWGATLANLAALAPNLSGPLSVEGRLHGPQDNLALNMESHGQIAVPGVPSGPVDATVVATGLPAHPSGQIDVRGQLAGAPITRQQQDPARRRWRHASHAEPRAMEEPQCARRSDAAAGCGLPVGTHAASCHAPRRSVAAHRYAARRQHRCDARYRRCRRQAASKAPCRSAAARGDGRQRRAGNARCDDHRSRGASGHGVADCADRHHGREWHHRQHEDRGERPARSAGAEAHLRSQHGARPGAYHDRRDRESASNARCK